MASGLRIIPESLRVREALTASYQTLGSPLTLACCLIKFVNNSSSDVTISWDGLNDHDFIPANSFALYDVCSDAGTIRGLYVPRGTQFYVKGTGVLAESVYLVAFHTSEDI